MVLATCLAAASAAAGADEAITLAQARQLALENSAALRADSESVGAAGSVVAEARAGYLPALSANVTAAGAKAYGSRNDSVPGSTLQPRIAAGMVNAPTVLDRAAAGVTVSQLVTDFGRTDNLVESAKASLGAARNGYEDRRQALLLEVTAEFYRVLEAQATLQVARMTVDERSLLDQQIGLLQKNKLKSELDAQFASVNLQQAQLLVLEAENEVDASRAALAAVIGMDDAHRYQPVDDGGEAPPPAPQAEGLIADALASRPLIKSLQDRLVAAQKQARAQRALAFPVLSLVGAAGTAPYGDDRLAENYAAGGVNLSIPIFQGGRLDAQYQEAVFHARQAQDDLDAAEVAVGRDVRVAWLAAVADFRSVAVAGKLRAAADQALNLAESRYRLGISSIVELNNAQLDAVNAEIGAIRARYEYRIAQARLAFETGRL